ncbi:FAD binding domain-containing protein [Microdochium bolleyi]|uniref:FAD binding domain-containing protein n=1 Tax=Microdochium bolleyi TaxID=196109 RepID=A0A136IM57_9PEZI|nr:FAD binding domain-containing protein [Microdochium bolleyi]
MRPSHSLACLAALGSQGGLSHALPTSQCLCLPGEPCWPAPATWSAFNGTVGGALVETVPIGNPCHDPNYDEAACTALQQKWYNPLTHVSSSSSIMQAYFTNQTCNPFSDKSTPCTLGNHVSYAVKVTKPADVAAALVFAKKYNIRPVVRNTGHDFLGRSTGAGGLAIWTQGMKNIEFVDWKAPSYAGRAVRVGAGVIGYEILEAAHAQGLTVVSGECATVGLAGGFTQGGGHSTLSTQFGLGADQVLAYEVVVADGSTVVATPDRNRDLYWALSGGGAGTFGVVTSMVVKAYAASDVGGAAFQLLASSTTPQIFQDIVAKFHSELPAMVDNGAMVVYIATKNYLVLKPLTAWNKTAADVQNVILKPFTDFVTSKGVQLPIAYSALPYRDHFARYLGPLPQGSFEVQRYQFGGRLIPRNVVEQNNEALQAVLANFTSSGLLLAGSAGSYKQLPNTPANSVLPAWRDTLIQLQLISNWNAAGSQENSEADQRKITEVFMPQIEAVTPGSGSYMNEADFRQPNWQQQFFGANYRRLLDVKRKWDPQNLFYVLKGVGSEAWTVAQDGKMCRA